MEGWADRQTDGWTDGRTEERSDGWMMSGMSIRWMDGQMSEREGEGGKAGE